MAIARLCLASEQICRPGRSSQDNALCKRLELAFDYARTKKCPCAFGACDLASCYDPIVHNPTSIPLALFGMIQQLVHTVRTLFGDSTTTFGGDIDKYFCQPQGTGQGNSAAPVIWLILSSTIFNILHKDRYSTPFTFTIGLRLFWLHGFAYMDGFNLLANKPT